MALGPSSPAWGWKVRLDELQAVLAFGEGKADTRGLSWTEHQALSRQIRNQVSLLEELAGGMSRKLTAWKREVGVPQGATAHTRADIQLLSGLLAETAPPSLEVGEGTEEEVVPETPPEVASASKAPQASLTYAEAAKGEGVEARVFMGLPSDRLRGLLVSLKADSGLAGVQAELSEQREKSNRTSNYKRGPLRAAIAEKKLVEQHLSYTLLQTEKKIADIQAILQQRAKDAARSRRQRAMEGRRDMSPGEESSKDLDSNSHHSPGEPSTSALATPGGAAETEGKAREKVSEEEWDGEKGEEWQLKVQDRGRGLIKESLLKFGNELGEDSVKDKKKKKKKKKNIARHQPETSVRGSGDSTEEGECSNAEYMYNDDVQALQKPGARDTNPAGGNRMPQKPAQPASVEVSGPPAALHGDRETIPAGTMACTGDPMEGSFPCSLPSDLPLRVVASPGVAGTSASCPQAAAGQDGTGWSSLEQGDGPPFPSAPLEQARLLSPTSKSPPLFVPQSVSLDVSKFVFQSVPPASLCVPLMSACVTSPPVVPVVPVVPGGAAGAAGAMEDRTAGDSHHPQPAVHTEETASGGKKSMTNIVFDSTGGLGMAEEDGSMDVTVNVMMGPIGLSKKVHSQPVCINDVAPAPGVVAPAPGVVAPAPGVVTPAPGVVAPAPGTIAPGVVAPAPGVVAPASGYVAPAPGTIAPAPGYVAPAPGSLELVGTQVSGTSTGTGTLTKGAAVINSLDAQACTRVPLRHSQVVTQGSGVTEASGSARGVRPNHSQTAGPGAPNAWASGPPRLSADGPATRPQVSFGNRRNVVRLICGGETQVPDRRWLVTRLKDMGFAPVDLYALIHASGTREFDVSFMTSQLLDRFWAGWEAARSAQGTKWAGFTAVAISRQGLKKVTFLVRNESIPIADILVWTKRFGDVKSPPVKILDEDGIWTGGWTVSVLLREIREMGHTYRTCPEAQHNVESIWSQEPVEMDSAGLGVQVASSSTRPISGTGVSLPQQQPILPSVSVTSQDPGKATSSRPLTKSVRRERTTSTAIMAPPRPPPPRPPPPKFSTVKVTPTEKSPDARPLDAQSLEWSTVKGKKPPPSKTSTLPSPRKIAIPPAAKPPKGGDATYKGGVARASSSSSGLQEAPVPVSNRYEALSSSWADCEYKEEMANLPGVVAGVEVGQEVLLRDDGPLYPGVSVKRFLGSDTEEEGIKSSRARFLVYDHLSRAPYNVILVQETRLETLAALHAAKRDWRWGPSYFSLATERYGGIAILFKDVDVSINRVIELQKGRCVVLDVSMGRQPFRIINIYGPQSKWERKRLFIEIEPYLYTSQQILFGGDFNTITRPQDRRDATQRLGYDSYFLNKMVSQAGLVDVYLHHTPNPTGGYTYHRGSCQSRIDRFFFKENFPVAAPVLTPVEFSDHHILSCELNVYSTPPKGRGIWRLNSDLLVEQRVQQAFMEFFHDQMTLADLGQMKSEWWEMVKARTQRLFHNLARNMQSSRYKMYLGLLGRLDILISQGGDPEDIAAVKNLMRSYQYDRYASLVKERDHGSYRSPDPYLSCKRKEGTKSIPSLRGTDGTLEESPRGILKVVRDYYIELLGKGSPQCSEEGTSHGRRVDDFLSELTLPEHSDLSFDELVSEITIEEVTESIQQQNKCKSPGPDGLTAEFYQQFCDLLAPHLTEVFNESLAQGLLPPSMRTSALILLSKPNVLDTADVGNWRPISLLNVDRKVLAKILMKRVQGLARRVLSTSQYCSIEGRTVFDAVFEVREALEKCRDGERGIYLLALDQSKAFDRVDHRYLWSVLRKYGLPGKFVNWIITLYRGAESFALVNGWRGRAFRIRSGVRQGCPLSPLLYVFAVDPFIRRVEAGTLQGVARAPERPLRVVAYADDISIVVSNTREATEVDDLILAYSAASASRVNRDKSVVFWCGKEGDQFPLPDGFPRAQPEIKILGVVFGPGDLALRNWTERLAIASSKVEESHRWKLTFRERDEQPGWVCIFREWVTPFLVDWFQGGRVKSMRVRHSSYLPSSVIEGVGILRRWNVTVEEVRDTPKKLLDGRVLATHFGIQLALKDCPPSTLASGLKNINSRRLPEKYRDVAHPLLIPLDLCGVGGEGF
ncbi:Hypothetical predicted protein [Pelobates cultripes]|uniref:Reverse transcriptase domain-containing protein n=1 Tax=Pelobates cultripes TaxID=61616 RepID=A0AAD1WQB2_PELCU|nr:Hypothetical predicted protein [Pelobates cultripes]